MESKDNLTNCTPFAMFEPAVNVGEGGLVNAQGNSENGEINFTNKACFHKVEHVIDDLSQSHSSGLTNMRN